MARIVDATRVDADTVRVAVEGVANVDGTDYPWRLELRAPRVLFFTAAGARRPKAVVLSLLNTHVWTDLAS